MLKYIIGYEEPFSQYPVISYYRSIASTNVPEISSYLAHRQGSVALVTVGTAARLVD